MMEITESFEIFLGTFGPTIIFQALDVFNKLQGVIIFILFVCNAKVLKLILRKSEPTTSLSNQTKDTSL